MICQGYFKCIKDDREKYIILRGIPNVGSTSFPVLSALGPSYAASGRNPEAISGFSEPEPSKKTFLPVPSVSLMDLDRPRRTFSFTPAQLVALRFVRHFADMVRLVDIQYFLGAHFHADTAARAQGLVDQHDWVHWFSVLNSFKLVYITIVSDAIQSS
jgi:hypothetical protein